MPKYIFAYHGGKPPETPEEGEKVMAAWGEWLGGMGDAVVDGGNPAGPSKTVSASGVADDGGANPLSGYSLVNAPDMDAAIEMAKGCPVLNHGTVEVCEAVEM
ncbi:YciI family protein [Sphingorhabdus sp. Alg239-R122]|uniref:YciI family protein n=1 Tax=Sphingorhabdus sp. Alg239-R122 TaxID=2305989 RepID=UPI0013D9DA60|nr:YciI family protein [Sphingorhabdus sp. Alg239-R122]